MELRDKNGLTEREYLAQYRADKYPRPSVTVDVCIFSRAADGALRTLLIRRGGHPFLGWWALPGGFAQPGERVEEAAARELEEETNLCRLTLCPVGVFSATGRDPRGWTLSCAYAALIEGAAPTARAGDDAASARWFDVDFVRAGDQARLTLRAQGDELRAEAAVLREQTPFGEALRCGEGWGQGLAFDHGEILLTALLRLR